MQTIKKVCESSLFVFSQSLLCHFLHDRMTVSWKNCIFAKPTNVWIDQITIVKLKTEHVKHDVKDMT